MEVPPGGEAPIQFRSGKELAELVGDDAAAELVGAENALLRLKRLADWDDFFDGDTGEVVPAQRVAQRKRLTVEGLMKAGLSDGTARQIIGR